MPQTKDLEAVICLTDKLGRIQEFQPMVKSEAIWFSRRDKTVLDQP